MSEQTAKPENIEKPEEEYPLAPEPPPTKIPPPNVPLVSSFADFTYQRSRKDPFQYTLFDLFALMTAVAVFMSILSLIALGGLTFKIVAGVTGIGAVFSLILLVFCPPQNTLLRLGWWVLCGLYLLASIGAVIFGW